MGCGQRPVRRPVAVEEIRPYVRPMIDRWFTDAAAAGPAAISPVFTPVEQRHFGAIIEFALGAANREWENLRCINAAGTRMHDMSVGWKSAPLTDKMKAEIKAGGGVRQWHNHPSQDSLSHSDWECAGLSPTIEILALNERGSIFVGRIVEWDERLHHLLRWFPVFSEVLELHMEKLAKARGLDIGLLYPLSKFTGHVLNCALAACVPVRYAYSLEPADQATVDACSALRIIQDGLDYARLAIEQELEGLRLWKELKTGDERARALDCMRRIADREQ